MSRNIFFVFLTLLACGNQPVSGSQNEKKAKLPRVPSVMTMSKMKKNEKKKTAMDRGETHKAALKQFEKRIEDLKRLYPNKCEKIKKLEASFLPLLEEQDWEKDPEVAARNSDDLFLSQVKNEIDPCFLKKLQAEENAWRFQEFKSFASKAWNFVKEHKLLIGAGLVGAYLGYDLFSYWQTGHSNICTFASACTGALQDAYARWMGNTAPSVLQEIPEQIISRLDVQNTAPPVLQEIPKKIISLPDVQNNTWVNIFRDIYEKCSGMDQIKILYSTRVAGKAVNTNFASALNQKTIGNLSNDYLDRFQPELAAVLGNIGNKDVVDGCLTNWVQANVPQKGIPLFQKESLNNLKMRYATHPDQDQLMKYFEGFAVAPKDLTIHKSLDFPQGLIHPNGTVQVEGIFKEHFSKMFQAILNQFQ